MNPHQVSIEFVFSLRHQMRHAARAGRAARRRRRAGIVVEIRPEPALDFLHGHSLAQMVVEHLVAIDLAEAEIARLRMREIKSADAEPGHMAKFSVS